MSQRRILQPNAEHPITVEPASGTVRVNVGDRVIAETSDALELREAGYPPVYYIPSADVDSSTLTESAHTTYCPYKGEASYHGIVVESATFGQTELADKVWYYPEPHTAVAPIAGHLAFYPDAVTIDFTPNA